MGPGCDYGDNCGWPSDMLSKLLSEGWFVGPGNPSLPTIKIRKVDPRAISNLKLTVQFKISGQSHYATYKIGNWADIKDLKLIATGGKWDGKNFVGGFLQLTKSSAGAPEARIAKYDPRQITNFRLTADFTIDGKPHHDGSAGGREQIRCRRRHISFLCADERKESDRAIYIPGVSQPLR